MQPMIFYDYNEIQAGSGDYVGLYGTGGLGNYTLNEFQISEVQTVILDVLISAYYLDLD